MTPDPAAQWASRLTWWVLHDGSGPLLLLFWLLWALIMVAALAYLWFLQGARIIAAVWVWRRAWAWWRSRSLHPGGAGGHTTLYERTMQSAGWRRRRSQAIRRARGRCQECGRGGRLDVHHTTYRDLGAERPWQLAVLCPPCHQAVHGRGAA